MTRADILPRVQACAVTLRRVIAALVEHDRADVLADVRELEGVLDTLVVRATIEGLAADLRKAGRKHHAKQVVDLYHDAPTDEHRARARARYRARTDHRHQSNHAHIRRVA
jgi:hypothetical protein